MEERITLYLCPHCFEMRDTNTECHGQRMLVFHPGRAGAANRRPLANEFGAYVSRAPRWYLEARRLIPAWSPFPGNLS